MVAIADEFIRKRAQTYEGAIEAAFKAAYINAKLNTFDDPQEEILYEQIEKNLF